MFEESVADGMDGWQVRRPVNDGATTSRVRGSALMDEPCFDQGCQVVAGGSAGELKGFHDVFCSDLGRVHHQAQRLQPGRGRRDRGASLLEARSSISGPVRHDLTVRGPRPTISYLLISSK